jgi:hypothetical protein
MSFKRSRCAPHASLCWLVMHACSREQLQSDSAACRPSALHLHGCCCIGVQGNYQCL